MMGEILLKGNGVLVAGQHANDRGGQLLALSPGEMMDRFGERDGTLRENPFHIDPTTRLRLSERDGFELRNVYESLVEGMYNHLTKQLGHLDPDETKRQLRNYVNQSAEHFNQENLKQGNRKSLYPHQRGMRGYGQYREGSASIFPDINSNQVHPELQKSLNVYTPEYQKVNSMSPHQVNIKNSKGQYVTLNHSAGDHKKWGHMSEGGFFGAMMQYLSLVANHWNVEAPSTMKQGYIKPEELVIHTDPMSGKQSNFWKYWGANEDPTQGHHHIPEEDRQHPAISLRSALGSLHPAFFQPAIHPNRVTPMRAAYAREILTRGGGVPVNDDDVSKFSQSVLMQILEDSRAGNNALRSASHTFHWYNQMREAAGLPKWSNAPVGGPQLPRDMPLEQQQVLRQFNHNRNHLRIGNHMNRAGMGHNHSAANKTLRDGLMLSMWLEQNPNNMEDRTRMMPHADGGGLETGGRLREIFRHSHSDEPPVSYQNFLGAAGQWLTGDAPPPAGRASPRADTGSWERGSIFPQMRLPMQVPEEAPVDSPAGPTTDRFGNLIQTSDDNLYNLMESLQSADARLDDHIIKSLPEQRRHDIGDESDLMTLCEHYHLSKSDIHYIQQSVGDWEVIAERLKVDPLVVKSVKVALRW